MRIGFSYDLKELVGLPQTEFQDAFEEYDCAETINLISSALGALGHSVVKLGGGREFLGNILRENVDIVFNIAEGRGTYRSREAQVPAVLEMLEIPYTGSDPQCLAICLDKPLTKKLIESAGVRTPRWQTISSSRELCEISWDGFPFPAIVKPAYEGSSKGIKDNSLAHNSKQAVEMMAKLLEFYRQPVMIEQFISGDEVTVGMVGNSPPRVLGMMRILPRKHEDYFVYSLDVKRDWKNLVDYECPARLRQEVLDNIALSSVKSFEVLGCRDFARVDFRVGSDGIPYFIEINPLPGLGDYSDLVIMALKLGLKYEELIGAILSAALERYPLCVQE